MIITYSTNKELKGLWFADRTNPSTDIFRELIQRDDELKISGEVDRLYFEVDHPVQFIKYEQKISVEKSGFADIVIWNPKPEKCTISNDM